MKNVILIGFMGAGKTTVGRELSRIWNKPVVDTDEVIVEKAGKSISEIFEASGEAVFRELETETLMAMPAADCIITTGGGIVLNERNRQWMKEKGIVFYLSADSDVILQRLKDDKSRPLLHGNKEAAVLELMKQRSELYLESSHFLINTSGKSVAEVICEIENCLGK